MVTLTATTQPYNRYVVFGTCTKLEYNLSAYYIVRVVAARVTVLVLAATVLGNHSTRHQVLL